MLQSIDSDTLVFIENRQAESFRRLHCLVAKGYVPNLGQPGHCQESMFLDHLGKGPDLILYPDGTISAINDRAAINPDFKDDPSKILNESEADAAAFDRFMARIPQPTWRERTRPDREKYIWQPLIIIGFNVTIWLTYKLIEPLWS